MIAAPGFRLATLTVALATCYPLSAHSAAGTLQFVIGDVSIRRGSNTIVATKGAGVESGDNLTTGSTGRAQIKFSDGGFIALQPNTRFEVTQYADTGDTKQDKFLVKLAEGGLRAITGAIGHRDHANYTVETPTALIGIRGSSFTAFYDPGDKTLRVANEQDSIQVCTSGGCVGLTSGETALVNPNTTNQQPARTNYRPTLPVPVPVQAPQVVSNQSTPAGTPEVVVQAVFAPQADQPPGVQVAEGTHPSETVPVPTPPAPVPVPTPPAPVPVPTPPAPVPPAPVPVPPPPAPVPVPTPPTAPVPIPTPPPPAPVPVPAPPAGGSPSPGPSPATTSVSGVTYADRYSINTSASQDSNSASGLTLDASGNPVGLTPASGPPVTSQDTSNTPLHTEGTVAGGDYFAIGTWNSYKYGVSQTVNPPVSSPMAYVVGLPTATTTLNGFSGQRATYSFLNATPVYATATGVSPGTVTSASLAVDFFAVTNYGQLSINVDMPAPTGSTTVTGTTSYALLGTVNSTSGASFSGTLANVGSVCLNGLATCTTATVQGFFNGSGADRVGLTFSGSSSVHGNYGGAVAFGSPTFGTTPITVDTVTANAYRAYSVNGGAAGSLLNPNDGLTLHSYEQINYLGAEASQLTDGTTPNQNILQKVGGTPSAFGAIGEPNGSNFVAWGYWSSAQYSPSSGPVSTQSDVHYISGLPTTTANLPVRGTGTYWLAGGSVPTFTASSGGSALTGSLKDATLNVSFYTQQVQADVNVSFSGTSYNIHRNLPLSGASFTGSTQPDQIDGFIAGDQGQYAGLVYSKDTTVGGASGRIAGSAVLQAKALVPPTAMNNTYTAMVMGADQTGMRSGSVFVKNQYIVDDTGNGKLLEAAYQPSGGNPGAVLGSTTTPFPSTTAGKIGTPDTAGFVGWGYWATGSYSNAGALSDLKDVHYIVATPTATMPTSGTATYSTIAGQTSPTFTTSGPAAAVSLVSATVSVPSFSGSTVNSTVNVTVAGSPETISDTTNMTGARFASTSPTAATQMSGVFFGNVGAPGTNPAGVGLVYSKDITGTNTGRIAGAVVLTP